MDAADDGVLHSMLFHSDTELAFACVYNTCYGWGSFADTNSSSALLMKLFWDYLFDLENNSGDPGNWQLGKAMAYSKDTMSPTINWTYSPAPGAWRAVIQGCLLFGDPAQRLKDLTKPPETPERPEGPTEGIVEVGYVFSTSTTDPEGENVSYLWDWGDGTSSEWTKYYDSGATATAFHSWAEEGNYSITVKAKDIHNAKSGWSDPPLTINIVDVPVLEIEDIHGSLFKVSVVIKNNGSTDATGVDWSITLDGGLIWGKETIGGIMSIPAGENITVKSKIICGLGRTVITASAEKPGVSSDTKERDAFVFLFFIKILDDE